MNPSCIGLIFDISDFCHDLLNLSFYKWSKSDHLVSHCEFMFIQVVLLRPHYLCIALINFICTPWLAIWGHKTRKTSEQFEVLIFDSAMGSVRNSFIVIESIWIKINVSIDLTVSKDRIRNTVALFFHRKFDTFERPRT